MPPFPWYIFQKNVPPICNSVKSSRNLTRTHYRNYMICKYNRFYQDCKCLRSWGPVGVTEKPRLTRVRWGFSFLLNHILTWFTPSPHDHLPPVPPSAYTSNIYTWNQPGDGFHVHISRQSAILDQFREIRTKNSPSNAVILYIRDMYKDHGVN